MSEMTRRSFTLGAAAAATLLTTVAPPAAQAARRTTIIVAPHPDDEVLRGAGYVNFCAQRGDKLILLALTDGDATMMGPRDGLTPQEVAYRRRAEQAASWAALTYGSGQIVRKGYRDGAITQAGVRTALAAVVADNPGAEVYAACSPTDTTPDHINTAQGCLQVPAAKVVRFFKSPVEGGGGTATYYPPDVSAAQAAVAAYWWTLGPTSSVGSTRNALVRSGYRSRSVRPR